MDTPKTAVDVFNKMAKIYEAKYMDVVSYGEGLDLFCAEITKTDGRVLELGCGPGNVTKYLLDHSPKLKILGTDLAPNMIELAKFNCPGASFQILDCRELSTMRGKFDGVVAGFCFPYLSNSEVLELIRNVRNLLTSGAPFYLSTMEGNASNSGIHKSSSGDEVFVHFYDREFLEAALLKNDFEIVKVWLQPDLTQKPATTDLIVLAKRR